MAARPLKSVPEGASGKPAGPTTVRAAAEAGDDRELLVRMRNRVAAAIDNSDTLPRDLAALTRRMQEIVKDIKAFDARDGEDGKGAPVPDESFEPSAI